MDTQRISGWLARFQVGRVARWLLPNGGTLLIVLALVLTANVWARPLTAPNAPGPSATTINYQGRLHDNAGNPVTTEAALTFTIYDALTGGNVIWGPETHAAVSIQEGLFSVGLGSRTTGGIPTTVWNGDRYLEVTVGSETLAPRELIRAVPIAHVALQALTLSTDTVNGTHLAHSGFGSSNVALKNFVVRGATTAADFTNTADGNGVWDLRPIVGSAAEMVVLRVTLADDADNSVISIAPNGETMDVYNRSFVRLPNGGMSISDIVWVRCDSNQTIQYGIDSKGSGNDSLTSLDVTVIGWIEPAATP